MSDLRAHDADLAAALGRLSAKVPFAELMAEQAVGGGVRVDTKSTTPTLHARVAGTVFRAWDGGRWLESATSSFSREELGRAVGELEQAAAHSTVHGPVPGAPSTTRREWVVDPARPMRDVPPEEILSLARDARGWAMAGASMVDAQVGVGWEDNERLYLNSAGARCFQRTSRVRGVIVAVVGENGRAEFDFDSQGGVGGREQISFISEPGARTVAAGAKELLHAAEAPTGEMTVLLDPSVAGLFAHESFGHGTEADQFVRDRSYLKPLLGSAVGPESLSIVDDGSFPGGWGSIYCDDEGHPGQRTTLVDHGRFVAALHDRGTAATYRVAPTGNTRRADFLSRPFVRMTNTFVTPADWSLDELVAEAKDGVLLERGTSGIEDPLGGQMQLKVKRGRRIEHGKLTRTVGSMALSGKVLDFMRAVRGVGAADGPMSIEPGYCGKGQTDLLPVGTGGVHLLSTAVVGPA